MSQSRYRQRPYRPTCVATHPAIVPVRPARRRLHPPARSTTDSGFTGSPEAVRKVAGSLRIGRRPRGKGNEMGGVSELISVRARRQPDDRAFIVAADGRALSWSALARHANRWCGLAGRRALPPRARIGLVAGDPLAFTAAYLGALAAGLTVVPVDPRLTPGELAGALGRLRVDVVCTDRPDSPAELERWA